MMSLGLDLGLDLDQGPDLGMGQGPLLIVSRSLPLFQLTFVMNFCSRHKTSLVPEECAACRSADDANKAVKPLVPPLDDFPSADKRFNTTRSDEKPSTLNLSDSTINVMDSVFSAGKFRSAKHFEACCLKIFI